MLETERPLIVATNGPLNFLPFQALHNGKSYLCEYLKIYRILSPAFLRALRPQAPRIKPGNGKLFIVSPSGENEYFQLSAFIKGLPSKRKVARLGKRAVIGKVRPQIAKFPAFLYLGDYFYQPDLPDRANLRLHESPGLTANDLWTQRYDLSNVHSVILYTGGLRPQELASDEPFMPIQRAFLTAGACNVATFLWAMDDSSLETVLSEIYSDFLSQGSMLPEAIPRAQSRLLSQPITSHPYFWAGIHSFNLTVENRNI
jgi:hypothetical protein